MNRIEWKEKFSVGHSGCDKDYKCLIGIINRLEEMEQDKDVDDSDYSWVIGELINYAQIHFLPEEQLMEQVNYRKLFEHRLEHTNLTKWLEGIK